MWTAKTDQTGRMPRLIRVFAGRTLTLLVLSCRGSYYFLQYTTVFMRNGTLVLCDLRCSHHSGISSKASSSSIDFVNSEDSGETLRGCTDSPESLLCIFGISTIFSWVAPYKAVLVFLVLTVECGSDKTWRNKWILYAVVPKDRFRLFEAAHRDLEFTIKFADL